MWTWALTGRGRAVGAELEGIIELSYSQPGPEGWHRQLAAILATVLPCWEGVRPLSWEPVGAVSYFRKCSVTVTRKVTNQLIIS